MTENLFYSELMLFIIIVVAALVLREFIRSRDGMLRKLMICYFAVEIYVYAATAVYFWLVERRGFAMSIDIFRLLVLAPKVVVKLMIFWYLVKLNKNS